MYTGRFLVCISGSELRVSTCSVIDWLDFIHIAHKHHLKFLAGDAFVITIVALLPWCSSVCPSICLSGTGVHCDHTEHDSVDLSSWLDSPMFWAPWRQSMSTYSQPSFSSSTWNWGGVWTCKLGVIAQERLKIEVKLQLSANRKSYIPRQLAQQPWVTLNGCMGRYLCGSWASC